MRLTQPFAVDYSGGQIPFGGGKVGGYADLGLKGHNGWDLSLEKGSGTICYAAANGVVESDGSFNSGYGLNIRLYVPHPSEPLLRYEVVYGHLQKVLKTGGVNAGEPIGECDNSGFSTGPHLHFGIRVQRKISDTEWRVENYNNGFYGYVDPAGFFAPDVTALPVDKRYGLTERSQGIPSLLEFYKHNMYFLKTQKRLATIREYNMLRFGFYPLREVLDPALFPITSEMPRPEAVKRGLLK